MSSEYVDFVRRSHQHFAATGAPLVDRIDPEIEVVDHDSPDAVGARSGVSVDRDDAVTWTFRDRTLIRIDYLNAQDLALEAAGVSEQVAADGSR